MSVSHPLVKELKGHIYNLQVTKKPLNDDSDEVIWLCECLERIFKTGLLPPSNYLIFPTIPECWQWIKKLGSDKFGAPYSYVSCVESVQKCEKVMSNRGRLRLFIRMALMSRCIHVPIQLLVGFGFHHMYYSTHAVLGDEILIGLVMPLLMFCSKINFKLELKNSRFLDDTWSIPTSLSLTVVPCYELGINIMFVNKVPIVTSIIPNSVADDAEAIGVGDVLDEVNCKAITINDQGNLSSLLRLHSGPITLHVLKGSRDGVVFPALVGLLRSAGLEPSMVAARSLPSHQSPPSEEDFREKVVEFVGIEETGEKSDVKQIHFAISRFLNKRQKALEAKTSCKIDKSPLQKNKESKGDKLDDLISLDEDRNDLQKYGSHSNLIDLDEPESGAEKKLDLSPLENSREDATEKDDEPEHSKDDDIQTKLEQMIESHFEIPVKVVFSFHDLGIKIKLTESVMDELLFEHSFMEISCCGSTNTLPQFFAYIAGDKDYVNCKSYKCFIFHSTNQPLVEKILKNIAQGFKRTLCTV